MSSSTRKISFVLACLTIWATAANATLVRIEPDNFSVGTDLSHLTPGVTLSTFRGNSAGPIFDPVYATTNIYSAPTGDLSFGHSLPSASSNNFKNVHGAEDCLTGDCVDIDPFRVFRADFSAPTDFVQVWTTIYWYAADGAEFGAYDINGNQLSKCHVHGVGGVARTTGVLAAPTGGGSQNGLCGEIIERIDCGDLGGFSDCSYRIRLDISRPISDIAFVMWGNPDENQSTAPVDNLVFTAPDRSTRVPEPASFGLLALGISAALLTRRRRLSVEKAQSD